MKKEFYSPSGTYEFYEDGIFYNNAGDQLRDPSEFDCNSEGYTPFGDE